MNILRWDPYLECESHSSLTYAKPDAPSMSNHILTSHYAHRFSCLRIRGLSAARDTVKINSPSNVYGYARRLIGPCLHLRRFSNSRTMTHFLTCLLIIMVTWKWRKKWLNTPSILWVDTEPMRSQETTTKPTEAYLKNKHLKRNSKYLL